MRKILLIALFGVLLTSANAQFKFGLRGGFSSENVKSENLNFFPNDGDTLTVGIADVNGGYHFGVFMRVGKKFYVQPEVLFNADRAEFTLRDLSDPEGRTRIRKEKYQYVDVPLMLGWKMGAFRLQGGPVAHFHLDTKSDLKAKENFERIFEETTYGYQAGAGLDIWNVSLDVKYEGNFTDFGDKLVLGNQELKFDNSPHRWIFTVGVSF